MNPLLLLLISLGIVLGGILWLRLHPFLALILGACVVGGFTAESNLLDSMHAKFQGELQRQAIQQEIARISSQPSEAGSLSDQTIRELGRQTVESRAQEIEAEAERKARQYVQSNSLVKRVTTAFGATCEKIGLLIAMACVVGRCLLASGAAERIVRSALSAVGDRGAPLAFSASSFVLSIPVFFDSVFLLVIPLAKATWLKLRKNYLLFVLALVTGGTMTHSLVPPTPGPLFVAEELEVGIGTMIMVGMAVGLCCTAVGLAFAAWLNRRYDIPVRDSEQALRDLEALARKPVDELPSIGFSLAPVLLPVLMISGASIYKSWLSITEQVPPMVAYAGDKNFALSLSAVFAILLAARGLKDRRKLADHIQQAMQDAGLIILICCAGGAFGATLQQSGIGPYISSLTGDKPLDFGLLPLAFVVTAVVRGAQGSSTVAMFTAVAIVRSLAPDLADLSYHPVYLAVSIGCGSKPFPWMNDSGFWVISKMSGLTEEETLKTHTPMVTLMGCTGIVVTTLAAYFLPMAAQ